MVNITISQLYMTCIISLPLIKVSESLQTRRGHSTTATRVGPKLTEAVIFGGLSGFPVLRDMLLADTTILQFSEWSGACRIHTDERGSRKGVKRKIWTPAMRSEEDTS